MKDFFEDNNLSDVLNQIPKNYFPKMNDDIIFFPIRHHSPIVSYQLSQLVKSYKPDLILVEGPENLNEIKEGFLKEGSKLPLAFYCIVKEKKTYFDDENNKKSEILTSSVYYPFTEFSPEYQAIKLSKEFNVDIEFIDLDYSYLKKYHENYETLLNESQFSYSEYINLLLKKLNLNDFNELWENYFESSYFNVKTEKFISDFYKYCYFSRKNYNFDDLKKDATLIREVFMASKISNYRKKYSKIIVVAGGFHIPSLIVLTENKEVADIDKILNEDAVMTENYIVPYSYDSIDERSGYKSGIIYPYYREKLLKLFLNFNKDEFSSPYEENLLNFLHEFHRKLKKINEAGTIVNKIEVVRIMNELKSLRDKPYVTIYEFRDALISAYAKGEEHINIIDSVLNTVLTGKKRGKYIYRESDSPIIKDFHEKLKKNNIKSENLSLSRKIDIYPAKNDSQKKKSIFFHKLLFLNINFAVLILKNKKQLGLYEDNSFVKLSKEGKGNFLNESNKYFSELWEYSLKHDTYETIIEASFYGSSIDEAVVNKFEAQWSEVYSFEKAVYYYISMLKLEIKTNRTQKLSQLMNILENEVYFSSLVSGFMQLDNFIFLMRESLSNGFSELYEKNFSAIIKLLYMIDSVSYDEEEKYSENIKIIASIVLNSDEKKENFIEAIKSFKVKNHDNLLIRGTIDGILYNFEDLTEIDILNYFDAVLYGVNPSENISRYLNGLFVSARELFLLNSAFIEKLSYFFMELTQREFIEVLPDFKRVFNFFTPVEQGKIAKNLSKIFNLNDNFLEEDIHVNPEDELIGLEINKETDKFLKEHKLI